MAAGKQTAIFRGSVITIHYYKLLKIAVDRTVLAEGRQIINYFRNFIKSEGYLWSTSSF